MTKKYWTDRAWIDGCWLTDVQLHVDSDGKIAALQAGVERGDAVDLGGVVIPGIPNVHSHAFQWTFAGLSEFRTVQRDSFWSWREQMYHSVERLSPEAYYHRACRLFRLMLAAGYTEVGEFHYIHNQPDGRPYPQAGLLADQLVQAAVDTGIAICMLPVLYQRGGFDGRPLVGAQRRFQLSIEQLQSVAQELLAKWGAEPRFRLGLAFHSLRAVDPDTIGPVLERLNPLIGSAAPVHIHVAEQTAEIADCQSRYGKRPVELLLDTVQVDGRWCLIHATHMTEQECGRLAESGAVAGLCPTTEANLGDGLFPVADFIEAGGRISIGSDSHVALDPFAELRLLEYGQRLTTHRRAVLSDTERSCGDRLLAEVLAGGCRAMGHAGSGQISLHQPANLVVLDAEHPALSDCPMERIIDRAVFCQWGGAVRKTLVRGQVVFDRDEQAQPAQQD
ncbi:MAG: formimidoylglutamate deiminase [Mariniblastus sp.]|nr:formimidoylglutamate deiminase [Mariniblastus sp.]